MFLGKTAFGCADEARENGEVEGWSEFARYKIALALRVLYRIQGATVYRRTGQKARWR